MPPPALLLVLGLAGRGLIRTRPAPLNAATLATPPPGLTQEPWRWQLRTDDGLKLDASDLREQRSYWLRDLISIGKSRVLIRVADRLFGTTIWSAFIATAYEVERNSPSIDLMLKQMMETLLVPTWPHEAVGGFLAILLVFRTDQAYERFWEARGLWASVHTATRALAMLALSHYCPGPTRDMLLAHSTAFPIALKQHLRGQRNMGEIERIFEAYTGPHIADAERGALGSNAVAFIRASDNLPSAMLTSLSLELATLLRAERLDVDDPNAPRDPSGQRQAALWAQLQSHVDSLTEVIACCERLKLTPIPLSYSRHTSRFFTLYLLTLPFTLVRECNALTVPAICLGIGYVLYAMEEIGHVIEEPFSLTTEARGEATDFSLQSNIARGGTSAFLGLVSGFYRMLAMVLAYKGGLDDAEIDRGVQPLEVLPLRKYCAIIELEIANAAALVVARESLSRKPREVALGGFGSSVKGMVGRTFQRMHAAPADGVAHRGAGDAERYHAIAEAAVNKLHDLNELGSEGMP
jgi:predicted membrane chloride channel (bestrophin family)